MQPVGATAIKPVERHGFEAFSYFLHNPDTGEFMGRTPKSWLLITVFYIIYYGCLAGFWAACMFVFFTTIDNDVPRWTQDGSLIGRSGALGVRPEQEWALIDSSMIIFNKDESDSKGDGKVPGWQEWADRTREFLVKYEDQADGVDCKAGEKPEDGKFCKFKLSELGPVCGDLKGNFGYDVGQPCVYLKLNRIYGLEPEYYNDEASLPDRFPERVMNLMAGKTHKDYVWVDCHGEHAADTEGMGEISHRPTMSGYSSEYFPYMNQKGYVSPLVAVQFKAPKIGQFLHVECRGWAQNMEYDRRDKLGKAHFELMVHDKDTAKVVNKNL